MWYGQYIPPIIATIYQVVRIEVSQIYLLKTISARSKEIKPDQHMREVIQATMTIVCSL